MGIKIDDILRYPNRSLRAYPGKVLMGPVGDRLFADCLDKKPGFCGHVDYIHKMNLDCLFEITCSLEPDYRLAETVWYPSHLDFFYEDEDVKLEETKCIIAKDIAFAAQTWTNKGETTFTLTLDVHPTGCEMTEVDDLIYIDIIEPIRGLNIGAAAGWSLAGKSVEVQPGETISLIAAGTIGCEDEQPKEQILAHLEEFLAADKLPEEYVAEAIAEYTAFFDTVPVFESNDQLLDKTWWYRWYILRNATAQPKIGYLPYTTVYEGRGHKTSKSIPLKVGGWEFSRLINLSPPLHLTDYRWAPCREMLHDVIRGYFLTMDDNGLIRNAFHNHMGGGFANYMIWAAYRLFLLDGDVEFVKEMIPAMQKNIEGNIAAYGNEKDLLQIEVKHQRTGKEYQPSYWYFNNFPLNGKDKSLITPVKRMDSSVYHYLNILGLARMMEAAGDAQAAHYFAQAEQLAKDINEKTWDEETEFYYDLHHETDEKAMVKNIVGVYPYWAEISPTDESHLHGLEKLFDPELFNTGAVFSTVAKDCVAYAPHGGWMGTMKSRDGCVWDGPSWPYTNGIALEAVARQSKLNNHKYDGEFAEFLRKYSLEHYRNHELSQPYLVEQYHAMTDEPLSDEPDYNHSYYLNLLVEGVAGINVEANKVVIDPCDVGLKHFKLSNLNIRGKLFVVELKKTGKFVVTVDGTVVSETDGLTKVEVAL